MPGKCGSILLCPLVIEETVADQHSHSDPVKNLPGDAPNVARANDTCSLAVEAEATQPDGQANYGWMAGSGILPIAASHGNWVLCQIWTAGDPGS